jgi:hypothetical protein
MSVVHDIIDAFGNQVAMANATGISQQTISEWANREPPEIPPWRRSTIATVANAKRIVLSPEVLAYLHSTERTKRAKQAA